MGFRGYRCGLPVQCLVPSILIFCPPSMMPCLLRMGGQGVYTKCAHFACVASIWLPCARTEPARLCSLAVLHQACEASGDCFAELVRHPRDCLAKPARPVLWVTMSPRKDLQSPPFGISEFHNFNVYYNDYFIILIGK